MLAHWSWITHGAHTVFAWSVHADVWYWPLAHEVHCVHTGFDAPLHGPLRKYPEGHDDVHWKQYGVCVNVHVPDR